MSLKWKVRQLQHQQRKENTMTTREKHMLPLEEARHDPEAAADYVKQFEIPPAANITPGLPVKLEATTYAGDPVLLIDGKVAAEIPWAGDRRDAALCLARELARRYNAHAALLAACEAALNRIMEVYASTTFTLPPEEGQLRAAIAQARPKA